MENIENTTTRSFGKTGLEFFPLGLGTIWLGRKWPMDNDSYRDPEDKEIEQFLQTAFERMGNAQGTVMIDTAAAYGYSEEKLGEFFRANPHFHERAFIATKWGEEFDVKTQTSHLEHSLQRLSMSVKRSQASLGKIDLLYIHGTSPEVLRDAQVMRAMQALKEKKYAGIKYIGASISREDALEVAVQENIDDLDVIQLPADLFEKREDLIDIFNQRGVAIVLNAVIRGHRQDKPADRYERFLQNNKVAMILTGTRHHLVGTTGYVT